MNKDELKKEAEEKAKKRVKGFKCQDNCEKSYVMGALDFAEPREKRIAELERKLEQTEKDLADYQFNYPTIKELEKENAELKEHIKADCIDCTDYYKNKRLEQENAELKELKKKKEEIEIMIEFCKTCKQMHTDQLTKAKRIIKNLMLFAAMDFREYEKEYKEAEQFLKDSGDK